MTPRDNKQQTASGKPGRSKRTSRVQRAPSGVRAQPATDRLRAKLDAQPGGRANAGVASTPGREPTPGRVPSRAGGEEIHTADRPPSSPRARRPQRDPTPGFVAVGRVLAPFGLRGELKVQSLTDNPLRFAPKSRLYAGDQLITIAEAREAAGHLYVRLKGFADRTSVERFRQALLQVPEQSLPPLPAGEYYRFQLIGLAVVDRAGALLGTLDEVIETGANDVYRVRTPAGADLLLPAIADVIISIELEARRMVADPPDWR